MVSPYQPKTSIIALVEGSDLCRAEGYTVKDNSPILAMCCLLVEAGFDAKRPLLAFRGNVLAMRVKSIGYGARYSVAENQKFGSRLACFKAFPVGGVAKDER
jgi:hypothetical protein